jgi:uridine kinase
MSTHNGARIHPGLPRTSVLATFPDGRIIEAPIGTAVADIVRVQAALAPSALPVQGTPAPFDGAPVVAVMLNGRLRELTTALTEDAEITPVTTAEGDGVRIYRRALSFLLVVAAGEVFPGAQVSIEHSASTVGGYFCEVQGREPFTQDDLVKIEARMRDIVAADVPIVRHPMSVAEAMALFHQRGELRRERLMAHREKETVVLHALRGRQEYFQGYMVPSTGCLKYFGLHAFPPGFLLQFPHQSRPTEIAPVVPYPKLFSVFEEASHLLDRLGVRSAGALNDVIASGRLDEVSLVGEAMTSFTVWVPLQPASVQLLVPANATQAQDSQEVALLTHIWIGTLPSASTAVSVSVTAVLRAAAAPPLISTVPLGAAVSGTGLPITVAPVDTLTAASIAQIR